MAHQQMQMQAATLRLNQEQLTNIGGHMSNASAEVGRANALYFKSLKHLAICLRQTQDWGIMHWRSAPVETQDWGIMHWRSAPVETLPKAPCNPLKFDDSLPVIPPPANLWLLIAHGNVAHANEMRQCHSTASRGCCLAGGGAVH